MAAVTHNKDLVITLTFDDGPNPKLTPRLLRILEKQKIKAAFFVLGRRVQESPAVTKAAFNEGHQIGNHSFSHADLATLPLNEIEDEIERTQNLIDSVIGGNTGAKKYFRPPNGSINEQVRTVAQRGGYTLILWDINPRDRKDRTPVWLTDGLSQIKPQGRQIIVNHDSRETTIDNMEAFITAIRNRFPNASFGPLT